MENNNRRKLGTYQICLIALAIVMNVIGGQIALALRLPIYLDSIGTIMIGAMLGPWCGLIPGLLGGLIMALLTVFRTCRHDRWFYEWSCSHRFFWSSRRC